MKYFLFIASAILLSSCASLTPFTQDLHQELNLSENEIKRVQFYLSDDIVLYRQMDNSNSTIQEGKIKFRKGQKIQEIVFKEGTPGVVIFQPKENRFAVSFDENDDKFLMFGPNKKYYDRYSLLGKDWNRNTGQVTYGNETFYTDSENALTSLMVNVNKVRSVTVDRSSPSGRKVK